MSAMKSHFHAVIAANTGATSRKLPRTIREPALKLENDRIALESATDPRRSMIAAVAPADLTHTSAKGPADIPPARPSEINSEHGGKENQREVFLEPDVRVEDLMTGDPLIALPDSPDDVGPRKMPPIWMHRVLMIDEPEPAGQEHHEPEAARSISRPDPRPSKVPLITRYRASRRAKEGTCPHQLDQGC